MQHHPIMPEKHQSSFLLLLLTTSMAWVVPLAFLYYAFPVVPVIRAATLTSALVVALMSFTSWAEKKGLSFLGPLVLLCFVAILVLVLIVLWFFLQWKTWLSLCKGFTAFLSCVYIVYFSSSLMQHPSSGYNVLDTISLFHYTAVLFLNLFNLITGY